jgi:hypothetical protein
VSTILNLADPESLRRSAERSDEIGAMLQRVIAAADADAEFQRAVAPMLRGFARVTRRRSIEKLRQALGMERAELKKYLRAAGLVNEMD